MCVAFVCVFVFEYVLVCLCAFVGVFIRVPLCWMASKRATKEHDDFGRPIRTTRPRIRTLRLAGIPGCTGQFRKKPTKHTAVALREHHRATSPIFSKAWKTPTCHDSTPRKAPRLSLRRTAELRGRLPKQSPSRRGLGLGSGRRAP